MEKLFIILVVSICSIYNLLSNEPIECTNGLNNPGGTNSLLYCDNVIYAATGSGWFLYTGQKGVFRSTDKGNSWQSINSGLESTDASALYSSDNKIYVGTAKGLYYSTNKGENWIAANNGLKQNITSIIKYEDYLFVSTPTNGVYRSNDNGQTWTQVKNGMDQLDALCLAVKDNMIICGTLLGGAYFSTDKGNTWIQKNEGLANTRVVTLLIVGEDIYAGSFDGGVYYSSNNGDKWEPRSNGFIDDLNDPWYMLSYNNKVYAAVSRAGLYESNDKGLHWNLIYENPYLPNQNQQNILALTTVDNYIFFGNSNGKIFKLEMNTADVNDDKNQSVRPYPNPANDYIIIDNPEVNSCSINIYNNNSKLVLSANYAHKQIRINTSSLSAGMYFVELKSNDKTNRFPIIISK